MSHEATTPGGGVRVGGRMPIVGSGTAARVSRQQRPPRATLYFLSSDGLSSFHLPVTWHRLSVLLPLRSTVKLLTRIWRHG